MQGAGRARAWGAFAAVLAVLFGPAAGSAFAGSPAFERQDIDAAGRDLFDLGVADVDDDLDLDLFTSNHLSRQSVMVNYGAGGFAERGYELGFAHTRAFPGWEEQATAGAEPGLHLYHVRSALHLRMVGGASARGSVRFLLPTKASSRGPASARVRKVTRSGADAWVARYRLGPGSHVKLDPTRMAHPFRVRVAAPFPLGSVHVGASDAHPADRSFTLQLRDRHGMAWADLWAGSATDVYMVRGGLQGEIERVAGIIEDELLLGGGEPFSRLAEERAPRKGTCRARQAGAVDFTGDGRLDVFSTCRGSGLRLHRQTGRRFAVHPSGELEAEAVRWLDLDGDAALEVLGAYPRTFATFDAEGGVLRRTQSIAGRQPALRSTGFAPADFDADGDQDVYAFAPGGSTMLRMARGRLRASNPARLGLPPAAQAAAWCDFDNDGLQDLATVPEGLFRQTPDGRFAPVEVLSPVTEPREARLSCADLDLNGARDVVVAARSAETRRVWPTAAFMGADPQNHWLEVVLDGPPGNEQAVGAQITARAGGRSQVQWVGQNDTSLYSQGHYRAYFGLGDEDAAELSVRWPDGSRTQVGPVAADRLVEVER